MLKNELRLNFLHLRQKLTKHLCDQGSASITDRCRELPVWNLQRFHTFLPIRSKHEVDTGSLIALLRESGKEIVVPRVEGKRDLRHYLFTPETRLETNSWGIPEPADGQEVEPESLDVVFLPLLAFDRRGYRVGYGGGYYDQFLSRCRSDVKAIGLSFFDPVDAIADLHPADLRLDFAVTPETIYEF